MARKNTNLVENVKEINYRFHTFRSTTVFCSPHHYSCFVNIIVRYFNTSKFFHNVLMDFFLRGDQSLISYQSKK